MLSFLVLGVVIVGLLLVWSVERLLVQLVADDTGPTKHHG